MVTEWLCFYYVYILFQDISEIVKYTANMYQVNFRMFDKVDVIGDTASPLWTYLQGICLL